MKNYKDIISNFWFHTDAYKEDYIVSTKLEDNQFKIIYEDETIVLQNPSIKDYEKVVKQLERQCKENKMVDDDISEITEIIGDRIKFIIAGFVVSINLFLLATFCIENLVFKFIWLIISSMGLYNSVEKFLVQYSMRNEINDIKKDIDKFRYYEDNKEELIRLRSVIRNTNNHRNYEKILNDCTFSVSKVMGDLKKLELIEEYCIDYNIVDDITKEDLIKYKEALEFFKNEILEDKKIVEENIRKRIR